MRAIITKRNEDGTYDEVGMRNKTLTKRYKLARNLIKWGVPDAWKKVGYRVEWYRDSVYVEPYEVTYQEPLPY